MKPPRGVRLLGGLLIFVLLTGTAATKAKGSITFLYERPGVGAVVNQYSSTSPSAPRASGPDVTGTSADSGPQLVPLVGQVLCGHDPRIPGGLTCALPPPLKPGVSDPAPRPRPPSPDEVARRLADRAMSLAPRPRLRLAPARRGLTGLPSYFWLAERPRTIEARAGVRGISVTAQARPVQYVWTYGDGTDRATRGPGRRWTRQRPGSISHTYEGRGRYSLEVEVIWEARWRLGFSAWRSLGYFSNSATRPYRVRSIVAVLVKAR